MARLSGIAASAIAGLLLVGPGTAMAKDLCLYAGAAATPFLVARPWKLPGAGKCQPFRGTGGTSGMAHGTVCRSSDGAILRFGVTVIRQGALFTSPYTQEIAMGMDYPDLTSGGADIIVLTHGQSSLTSSTVSNIHAEACKGPAIN